MDNIIVMFIKSLGDHTCSVDGVNAVLEDTSPGRKEMLHHGVKMINLYYEVAIGIDLAVLWNDCTQIMPGKCTPQHYRTTRILHCWNQVLMV